MVLTFQQQYPGNTLVPIIQTKNKAKWFAKQLASESLHGKHKKNKKHLPRILGVIFLTKDRH